MGTAGKCRTLSAICPAAVAGIVHAVQRTMREQLRRVAAETFGWSQLRAEQLQAMEGTVKLTLIMIYFTKATTKLAAVRRARPLHFVVALVK